MRVTYTPADGSPPQTWAFKPDDVLSSAAELIENRSGMRYEEWKNEVLVGKAKARRVLLWHLLCRTHGLLRIEDVPDFPVGALRIDRDLDELLEHRNSMEKMKFDDPDIRVNAMAMLDAEIEAEQARAAEAGELGKAGSAECVDATPSPSLITSD